MIINIIVSASENWVIGKDNKLLWKLNDDMIRFKDLTTGKAIIMGQKTFKSLPKGALPNRTNIVLTKNKNFKAKNVLLANNIDEALNIAKSEYGDDSEVFIIGGSTIYNQFLHLANYIYFTLVHVNIEGDTTFPKIDNINWELVYTEFRYSDEKNEYDHTYKIYKNKNKLNE